MISRFATALRYAACSGLVELDPLLHVDPLGKLGQDVFSVTTQVDRGDRVLERVPPEHEMAVGCAQCVQPLGHVGLQGQNQVVEVAQAVLDRSAGQEERVLGAPRQASHRPRAVGFGVLDVVGLVDDQEIQAAERLVRFIIRQERAQRREGGHGDSAGLLPARQVRVAFRPVEQQRIERRVTLDLARPVVDHDGGRHDQEALAGSGLLQVRAGREGLQRLAEPHFVSQQRAPLDQHELGAELLIAAQRDAQPLGLQIEGLDFGRDVGREACADSLSAANLCARQRALDDGAVVRVAFLVLSTLGLLLRLLRQRMQRLTTRRARAIEPAERRVLLLDVLFDASRFEQRLAFGLKLGTAEQPVEEAGPCVDVRQTPSQVRVQVRKAFGHLAQGILDREHALGRLHGAEGASVARADRRGGDRGLTIDLFQTAHGADQPLARGGPDARDTLQGFRSLGAHIGRLADSGLLQRAHAHAIGAEGAQLVHRQVFPALGTRLLRVEPRALRQLPLGAAQELVDLGALTLDALQGSLGPSARLGARSKGSPDRSSS